MTLWLRASSWREDGRPGYERGRNRRSASARPDDHNLQRAEVFVSRYPFSPVLGWSSSRYQVFATCKRQYYYRYYGSRDPQLDQRRLKLLQDLTSGPLEVGSTVHDTLAALARRLQRTTRPVDRERFVRFGRTRMERRVADKRFIEAYYGDLVGPDGELMLQKTERCLRNFLESRWYEWLTGDALQYRSQWVIEPGDYGEMRIGGYKAYCKVDFAFPVDDGRVHVVEWKTGRPDRSRHNAQMRGYVAYAREAFAKAPANIRPHLVYLDDPYEERSLRIRQEDLDDLAATIRDQTHEMYQYCENPQENVPLPRDRFLLTEQVSSCRYCNFRELCGR